MDSRADGQAGLVRWLKLNKVEHSQGKIGGRNITVERYYPLRGRLQYKPRASDVTRPSSRAAEGGRDLRLDLLRGFCVFAMLVDHIGGQSWLFTLTGGNRFLVSAAEGFVFISGLVLGIVSLKRVRREGLRRAMEAILRRAGTLYVLTVVLTLSFASFVAVLGLPWGWDLNSATPLKLIADTLTLHRTFYLVDVLLLYTLLLLVAPAMLLALVQGWTKALVAAAWLLWGAYQLWPELADVPWRVEGGEMFPFAAWQVLFVSGLVAGYHRDWLVERARALPRRPLLAVFAALFGLLVLVDRGDWPGPLALLVEVPSLGPDLFAKASLAPGRLFAFVILLGFAYLATSLFWRPLHTTLGRLLLPLGQTALYAYTLQFAVIGLLVSGQMERFGYDPGQIASNTAFQIGAVTLIWLMIRRRVLFRIIPR